eukprot:TRINITY_DN776022_c0_g1_i1.p2 TRINITY_DN776022_c0_g1~~TRINITY_DN776022_c0_g1_i1.p2  ORF type:complete len:115 (-),score=24.90 TRINITY_DN776022_c0_g1_i1:869-1213(-)
MSDSEEEKTAYTPEEVKEAFKMFSNESKPNHISVGDLCNAIKDHATAQFTDEQIQELLCSVEIGDEGLINYSDYVDVMFNGGVPIANDDSESPETPRSRSPRTPSPRSPRTSKF